MNEQRTTSILQRVPVILAITAASYGLPQIQPSPFTGGNGLAGVAKSPTPGRVVTDKAAPQH